MKMVEADNRTILDKDGSYIENNRTGSRIKVRHENGSFMFGFWVPCGEKQTLTKVGQEGFPMKKPSAKSKLFNQYALIEPDDDDRGNENMDVGIVFVGPEELIKKMELIRDP